MNQKILLITLEFSSWGNASHWPYPMNLGLEEGLAANGVEYFTIPALHEVPSSAPGSWLSHLQDICQGKHFDQVWMEIVHSNLDESFLDWVTKIAPVRVGFICESMEIDPGEWINNPEGTLRRQKAVEQHLAYLTHIVAVDEADVERFNSEGQVPAMWWPIEAVPARFIAQPLPLPPQQNYAIFYGALYGERKRWLEETSLRGLLVRPEASPEFYTELPKIYDDLHHSVSACLQEGMSDSAFFGTYMESLRMIRRECFSLYLQGLQTGCAVVNLPQFGKIYAGRVAEGMAAGRPVITWEIPDRPKTKVLFEDGKEILLYDRANPEQLAAHIQRVIQEPDFARYLVENARKKIAEHSCEKFIGRLLGWLAEQTRGQAAAGTVEKNDLMELVRAGVWQPGQPLRLHLGCGEQYLQGYVNIDYPPSEHNVMNVRADAFANITELNFPPGSVDEIRLHHVFEHFNRVTALALLIKWCGWLKIGGRLHIETPDLEGSARTLLSNVSNRVKMGVVRHLVGDQAAPWAYHIDQWFPERFERTLSKFGFAPVQIKTWNWPHEPYLSNVEAIATKAYNLPPEALLSAADELLWDSTVAAAEAPLYEIWKQQLREVLAGNFTPPPSNVQMPQVSAVAQASDVLSSSASQLPLAEIHDFNQIERDRWMREKAQTIPAGSSVLDVGAGTCPYRKLFAHCNYKTHDFKQYEGVKLGGSTEYGNIDYVSDIIAIPVPDSSFDAVICTEVLEHVPEPIEALREFARILKPGGRLLLTAPLGSGLHQLPYHYYGGYTPEWYKHFAPKFGLKITEISPNGGFFRLLAQESARVAWTLPQHQHLHGNNMAFIQQLFGEWIPRYLFALEEKCFIDQFTVGYHVDAVKQSTGQL